MSETRNTGRHRAGGCRKRSEMRAVARLSAASARATTAPVGALVLAALTPDDPPAAAGTGSGSGAAAGGAPAACRSAATDVPVRIGSEPAVGAAAITIGVAVCDAG